jgi:phospholipid N-methyltransferase
MIERAQNGHLKEVSALTEWKEWVAESRLLFGEWRQDLRKSGYTGSPTATAFATTPRGVRHVCNELKLDELRDGDIVAEAGTGPGTLMKGVLRKVRADIRYVAIELNTTLAEHLEDTFDDSRVVVVNDSAEKLAEIVHRYGSSARRVISTMPFSTNKKRTDTVLGQVKEVLTPDGQFLMANFTIDSILAVIGAFGRENCETGFAFNIPPLLTVLAKNPKNGKLKH